MIKYVQFGANKRDVYYKLTDPFCQFWLHVVKGRSKHEKSYWQHYLNAQPVVVWRGLAFENVCFHHIDQIKQALGISGVSTECSAWSKSDGSDGAQIDMVIAREDNVVNMCEIKYYGGDFTVDRDYYKHLLARQELLSKEISPKVSLRSTLITTFGLTHNEYSGIFSNVITMDDLFA